MKLPPLRLTLTVCLGLCGPALAAGGEPAPPLASQIPSQPPTQSQTVESYRQHLSQLQTVLAKCSGTATAPNCDPSLVGPDDEVETPTGPRQVQYAWLRNAMSGAIPAETLDAQDKARAQVEATAALKAAAERLGLEIAAPVSPSGSGFVQQRKTLNGILAKSEFLHIQQPSPWDKLRNRFLAWLDERLRLLVSPGGGSYWLARIVFVSSIVLACGGLVFWFSRQARRKGLGPPAYRPNPSVPSALDWEKRLEAASRSAAAGLWREAIHGVYWAAISRLEAGGSWPADRTRTPREYLALLAQAHVKRADLAALTFAFERIWYGNRGAGERDFQQARTLLERLGAR